LGPEFEAAASELARRIDRSVARSVAGETTVAVAFSGGVDSAVLAACARRLVRVLACTGHTDRSSDDSKSLAAAKAMGIETVATEISREAVAGALARMELPFEPTLMDKSLWCLYSQVAASAARAGARVILLGQLADELFGGYAKYSATLEGRGEEAARSMMEKDYLEYAGRGRIRDLRACEGGAEPRFPYEDGEVVEYARSIPMSFKIAHGNRKAVLRRAAVILGVPEAVAASPKKAAQYSSGIQKMVAGAPF
jgi:asparagine synthase (glutamine-hydrolysing)